MNSLPTISVITPSLNQGRFIERSIQSVLRQRYPRLEYIIIDGGSTDETITILKKYTQYIKWISERDQGQADAINKGIHLSTGDVLAYLNADDMYTYNALSKVGIFFQTDNQMMWLTGRCKIIDEYDREIRQLITLYKNILLKHYSYRLLLILNPISQPATFWRRELVDEFGMFNISEDLVMDYEYWLRIAGKYRPAIIDDYLSCFRVHRNTKTSMAGFSNFKQELNVAKRYSRSRIVYALHYLHNLCIVSIYDFLNLLTHLKERKHE
jgi:glycosyltransferase involved in cell wall biosynthesis